MAREFICCECGRRVFSFGAEALSGAGDFCDACLTLPGWSANPSLRAVIDPTWIDGPAPFPASREKAPAARPDEGAATPGGAP